MWFTARLLTAALVVFKEVVELLPFHLILRQSASP